MTTDLAERRKGGLLSLFAIAGLLVAVAAVTSAIEMRASRAGAVSGLVLPGISESFGNATRISVTSQEAAYRIERVQRGEERAWVMRDRGNFAVQANRLAQLTQGLEQMRYVRRMTSDPGRHDRLGVTDPREGGRGVLVQVERGDRALLVDLILGVEPGGRLYVRNAGQDQVWQAQAEDLPPLRDVAAWLDLRPLDLQTAQLARAEIMPAEGRAYILARDNAEQPWRIATPALAAASQAIVTQAAEKLVQLSPTDVLEAPAVQGAPRARVRATTFDGVMIDGELVPSGEHLWLKLVARASTPEQEAAALAINNRVAAWAYELSDIEAGALAPPLSSLLPASQN